MNRKLFWGLPLFASSISEKYLRLAFFRALLVLFRASLNCFQIKGSFAEVAFLFRNFLLYMSRNSLFMIHGKLLFLVLFVLNVHSCLQHSFIAVSKSPHIIWGIACSIEISVIHLKMVQDLVKIQLRWSSWAFEHQLSHNYKKMVVKKIACLYLWMMFFGGRR